MSQQRPSERIGIAGTGAIARGLARFVGAQADSAAGSQAVLVWARSAASADAVSAELDESARVVTSLDELAACSYVIEAVVEDLQVKRALLERLGDALGPDSIIASTTSSLSIEELGAASGRPALFAGMHFFNPVERMRLVEVAFPAAATSETRRRSLDLCAALGKTAVEVPDMPGFVVNRLLFPFLFSAVALLDRHALDPATVDACMKLGAGHPMGPLGLLDLVGLDVAVSIGESIGEEIPPRVRQLVADGRLGRKSGAGFYEY